MKKTLVYLAILLSGYLAVLLACGGGGLAKLIGPDLNIGELTAIKVDQIKFTGGLEDDTDGLIEASLYLRCADSDIDVACAGSSQGLDIVKKDGVAYGRLNASFVKINDVDENNCFDVKLLFVEKDSNDCPAAISADDDIVWTSSPLTMNEEGVGSLLDSVISSDDGLSLTYLIPRGGELLEDLVQSTPAQAENSLKLDQLYFTKPDIDGARTFKLVVKDADNSDSGALRCEASFGGADYGIESKDIIYGNLGIDLLDNAGTKCYITDENKLTKVTVSLFISDSGDTLSTDETTTLVDLVDNDSGKETFGDDGFIKFVSIENIQ